MLLKLGVHFCNNGMYTKEINMYISATEAVRLLLVVLFDVQVCVVSFEVCIFVMAVI